MPKTKENVIQQLVNYQKKTYGLKYFYLKDFTCYIYHYVYETVNSYKNKIAYLPKVSQQRHEITKATKASTNTDIER